MPTDAYTFLLAWRWTQPTHNVLPGGHGAAHADCAVDGTNGCNSARGELDRALFEQVQATYADGSCEEGTHWLRALPVSLSEQVTVRWDASAAVSTSWEVLTQYWDDFCYPSSDDVKVFPASNAWLLLYPHWARFEWARRRQA